MSIAWLFPGQGSQAVGMGKELSEQSSAARKIFQRADEALGWSISKLCFEGPASDLIQTANAQPAILTASIAMLAALQEAYPDLGTPSFVAGHSLGEYSALVAAGALTLEDAVRIVNRRGKAMQEAVPIGVGAMAAVIGGSPEVIQGICENSAESDVVACANFNAPGQVVIAGHTAAIERARVAAVTAGLKVILLKVSAPFHCSLMAPAAAVVNAALQGIMISNPRVPVVTNVEGKPNMVAEKVADCLVRQVDAPVRWEESIRYMAGAGVTKALEIGPGNVLSGLVQRIDKRIAMHGVNSTAGISKAALFLNKDARNKCETVMAASSI